MKRNSFPSILLLHLPLHPAVQNPPETSVKTVSQAVQNTFVQLVIWQYRKNPHDTCMCMYSQSTGRTQRTCVCTDKSSSRTKNPSQNMCMHSQVIQVYKRTLPKCVRSKVTQLYKRSLPKQVYSQSGGRTKKTPETCVCTVSQHFWPNTIYC